MSNIERKQNLPAIIQTAETTFTELARRHQVPDFTFAREAAFAIAALADNEYLAEVAVGNPESLKQAIINVAAIGLSLSPIHGFAYLVPRKVGNRPKVCLDISYRGYLELSTSRGVLLWAKAEIVYDNDEFEYRGVNHEPHHRYNPFKDRGAPIGGYVLGKMTSGDLLVDFMPIHEIYQIRDRSDAWKAFKAKKIYSTPWSTDEGEMIKKTLIRRARKSWPSSIAKVIDRAVELSEDDKIDFEAEALAPAPISAHKTEGLQIVRELLEALERDEPSYIKHLCDTTNRKIEKLEDLTDLEVDQAVTFLSSLVEKQAAKLERVKRKEIAGENAG